MKQIILAPVPVPVPVPVPPVPNTRPQYKPAPVPVRVPVPVPSAPFSRPQCQPTPSGPVRSPPSQTPPTESRSGKTPTRTQIVTPIASPTRLQVPTPVQVPFTRPQYLQEPTPDSKPILPPLRAPVTAPYEKPQSSVHGSMKSPRSKDTNKPQRQPANTPTPISRVEPPVPVPTDSPTLAPFKNPTDQPSKPPSSKPINSPTSAPSATPISPPTTSPSAKPANSPTTAPVVPPTSSPVSAPTATPYLVPTPISVPTMLPPPTKGSSCGTKSIPATQCKIPKFVGNWTWYKELPVPVAESQGGLIGNDMVLVSGFSTGWNYTTPKVYAYDTTVRGAQWREMDSIPVPEGLTHTGHVVVNCTKLYMCGGYVGNYTPYHPAPTSDCYMYNHKATAGSQWQKLPSLPGPRAGGSMHYNENKNSLTFACGASRSDLKNINTTVDHNDVWELNLDNIATGWQTKAPIPYFANHVGFTSVTYDGVQRHYTLGGQDRTDEPYGNKDNVFQYDTDKDSWTAVTSMPFPRGHFASSTVSDNDGCGFFIVGGAVNGKKSTADVHYYSIGEDKWYKIGELPSARNTPVCVVGADNYLYCQGGTVAFKFSWRIQLA